MAEENKWFTYQLNRSRISSRVDWKRKLDMTLRDKDYRYWIQKFTSCTEIPLHIDKELDPEIIEELENMGMQVTKLEDKGQPKYHLIVRDKYIKEPQLKICLTPEEVAEELSFYRRQKHEEFNFVGLYPVFDHPSPGYNLSGMSTLASVLREFEKMED